MGEELTSHQVIKTAIDLQPHGNGNDQFREVGFGLMSLDVDACFQSAQHWKSIMQAYAFVIFRFVEQSVVAHLAVQVPAKRQAQRQPMKEHFVLGSDT